jgi:allantoate deiminase
MFLFCAVLFSGGCEMDLYEEAKRIEIQLSSLAKFSAEGVGVTRLPFTKEALAAVEFLAEKMEQAGLVVKQDASGAIYGFYQGISDETIVIGSHYDSVKCGGAYDGIAGVVCGIEIAQLLRQEKTKMPYSLEIVGFNDEEGVRFGDGFFSSKAALGEWTKEELQTKTDADGIRIDEAMKKYGLKPNEIAAAAWKLENIKCFMEIHIEQGPVLEAAGCELGIVDGIVGMRRYRITVKGQADHAGTTPMLMRHDALAVAAKVINEIETIGRSYKDAVATTGFCEVFPNTVNTVPQRVTFSLDFRSRSEKDIEDMEQNIMEFLQQVTENNGTSYDVQRTLSVKPVSMDNALQKALQESCSKCGYSFMKLSSGAGHDALTIGRAVPTAMVFVPSRGGRSHCPEEYTDPQDLAKAVYVVLDTIKKINLEE